MERQRVNLNLQMPRSSQASSSTTPSEEDPTRPAILASGRAPHSPPVYMHGISTPLTSPNDLDSPTRKKFKYLSPRIGSYFQADVEPFKVGGGPAKEDDTTVTSQNSLIGQSSTGTGRKKKAGRPKGGGRSSLKKQGSCCCYLIIKRTMVFHLYIGTPSHLIFLFFFIHINQCTIV